MKRAGFTVVELLVVVAIVAVLAGITVPIYQQVTARGRAAHCMNNLKQIGTALNLYLGDNHFTMPEMVAARESKDDEEEALDTVLAAYVTSPTVFRCVGDHGGIWRDTGTSYFWNSLLNGQQWGQLEMMGRKTGAARIPVVSDKENFHKRVGDEVNILYADGRVEEEVQFRVEKGRENQN
jgi:prepilin-type N-terminal cleavage/methylation domain-containing protein/prepilin-type processing-associated H-X9-DG protein